MKMRLIERVYLRLLEQSSTENLAVFDTATDRTRTAYIYDPQAVDPESEPGSAARGYISIRQPVEPCNKAWIVVGSWGRGLGDVVYPIGFALSPSGRLISDRGSASIGAMSRWQIYYDDRGWKKLPIDDVEHPPENASDFHDKHHTEKTSDDCRAYAIEKPALDYLNYTYDPKGRLSEFRSNLQSMRDLHEKTMESMLDRKSTRLNSSHRT